MQYRFTQFLLIKKNKLHFREHKPDLCPYRRSEDDYPYKIKRFPRLLYLGKENLYNNKKSIAILAVEGREISCDIPHHPQSAEEADLCPVYFEWEEFNGDSRRADFWNGSKERRSKRTQPE